MSSTTSQNKTVPIGQPELVIDSNVFAALPPLYQTIATGLQKLGKVKITEAEESL